MFKKPSPLEKIYQSSYVLTFRDDEGLNLLKNREGNPLGKLTLDQGIEVCSRLITMHKFSSRMNLFQEAAHIRIKEEMIKILKQGNYRR